MRYLWQDAFVGATLGSRGRGKPPYISLRPYLFFSEAFSEPVR